MAGIVSVRATAEDREIKSQFSYPLCSAKPVMVLMIDQSLDLHYGLGFWQLLFFWHHKKLEMAIRVVN